MSSGGRKLIILGIASALIALVTTGISLAIYHNSGDIMTWPVNLISMRTPWMKMKKTMMIQLKNTLLISRVNLPKKF